MPSDKPGSKQAPPSDQTQPSVKQPLPCSSACSAPPGADARLCRPPLCVNWGNMSPSGADRWPLTRVNAAATVWQLQTGREPLVPFCRRHTTCNYMPSPLDPHASHVPLVPFTKCRSLSACSSLSHVARLLPLAPSTLSLRPGSSLCSLPRVTDPPSTAWCLPTLDPPDQLRVHGPGAQRLHTL